MFIYLSLYTIVLILAIISHTSEIRRYELFYLDILTLFIIVIFGLRINVGMDYKNYYDDYYGFESHVTIDFMYVYARNLFKYFDIKFVYFNAFIYTFIFTGFNLLFRQLKNPLRGMAIFILLPIGFPYALNATRQFLALSVIGIIGLKKDYFFKILRSICTMGFHVLTGISILFMESRVLFITLFCFMFGTAYLISPGLLDVIISKQEWYTRDQHDLSFFVYIAGFFLVLVLERVIKKNYSEYTWYSLIFIYFSLFFLNISIEILVRFFIILWPMYLIAFDNTRNVTIKNIFLLLCYLYSVRSVFCSYESYDLLPFNHLFMY
jgi:hypothetical protein